jgi:hypothetical protein
MNQILQQNPTPLTWQTQRPVRAAEALVKPVVIVRDDQETL